MGGAQALDWCLIDEPEDLFPLADRTDDVVSVPRREVHVPRRRGLATLGSGYCELAGMGFAVRMTADERPTGKGDTTPGIMTNP